MPREPFLVNPPRRIPASLRRMTRRKARSILHHGYVRRRRRRIPLTGAQRRMFGAIASGYRLRGRRRRRTHRNPLGDELVVLGALNPRRRRRAKARKRRKGVTHMARRSHSGRFVRHRHRRRRARAHRNPFRRRSHARRRRRAFAFNPHRPHRHRRARARHRRNRARRYRRNPATAVGGIRLMQPGTWFPYVMTAAASGLATGFAPRLLGPNVTPMWAYGAQAAVAVAGAVALPMFLKPAHGVVWFVVGIGIIVADAVARYLLPMTGLAAYPYQAHAALAGMGQQPYYPPTLSDMGYYPTTSELSGVGAYEPVPGALAPMELQYGAASRVGAPYWK